MFPADSKFSDWLGWFVSENEMRTPYPFVLPDGRRCATNGIVALITSQPGRVDELARMKSLPDAIVSYLADIALKSQEFSAAEMLGMFGPCEHPEIDTCESCNGTGYVDHECNCELCEEQSEECGECEGKGKSLCSPDDRYVRVWGCPVNANRVAYVLAHAPASERYTLETIRDGTFRIVAAEWTSIVCGLTTVKETTEKYPEVMPGGMVTA